MPRRVRARPPVRKPAAYRRQAQGDETEQCGQKVQEEIEETLTYMDSSCPAALDED